MFITLRWILIKWVAIGKIWWNEFNGNLIALNYSKLKGYFYAVTCVKYFFTHDFSSDDQKNQILLIKWIFYPLSKLCNLMLISWKNNQGCYYCHNSEKFLSLNPKVFIGAILYIQLKVHIYIMQHYCKLKHSWTTCLNVVILQL